MLSPKSQKNVSEEDSSGSDAGSEVGPEPETDRFGFILTNGSTAGTVGPPPELVRQRETKWIHIISQWDRILLKKTSKVKVQCQKGIPASLRAKCWPLLCGATDQMKQNENLYQSLDSQPALQSWVEVIERDLDRQFPFHEMFLSKDGHGQRGLFRVLKAFTQYKPEEGYCQAQGPVAAVLLMNMPAEEAFWCLVQISEQYLPGYYSPLLEGVLFDAGMLTWVLKRTCPAAHKHLQHHGVEPLMFATDWLMCLFTRHLPFNTLLRVWDLFFCHGVRVLLQVAVVLVRRVLGRAEQRKQCQGQMETLERLRGVREEVQEEDDPFIAEVCSVQLSARDLEKQTEKELKKWRTDRPSSTFDPRSRCQGYRMAWASGRQNEEERDMKEREKGNLSVPLARSASTLSLSPSLLGKRWGKGGKTNTREWESGGRVVRHLSMGAKEDCRSWAELNFKKVKSVEEEEDTMLEEPSKQTGFTEQEKPSDESENIEIRNISTEHEEETVKKELVEQVETRITEKEDSQLKETEESNISYEQGEELKETEESNISYEQGEELKETEESNISYEQGEELKETEESNISYEQGEELKETEESNISYEQGEELKETEESNISYEQGEELKETEESNISSEQTGETTVETDQSKDQTVENTLQPAEHKQGEELKETEESNISYEQGEELKETEESNISYEQGEELKETEESNISYEQGEELKETEENNISSEQGEELKETEESNISSEQTGETTVETDQSKDQTVENTLRPAEHKHGEELDSCSQSQVLEQQSHESKQLEIEVKETNDETEKQVEQIEHTAAAEENLTDKQKVADKKTITEEATQRSVNPSEQQMIQADMKPLQSPETEHQTQEDTASELKNVDEASNVTSPTVEIVTQQQEVITVTDISSQGDAFEGKYHSTSLAATDMQEESLNQTQTDTEKQAQTEENGVGNAGTQN
ncbi:hypothetical protein PBY51_015976 [Eleginops maclovinus]|uniref:Rab-GAP TBC domain-containing protein n=1 Tax=Eleginops maclovinus TaxID=56733 RepID=A0AAN8ARN7_ELEMC|nr:hypothetical protein PBY51_015976 [Eleginops maclovinus]